MKFKEPKKSAPCKEACPANVDIPRYFRYLAIGDAESAVAVIRETIPIPATVGRVCFRPCEDKCNCKQMCDPIAINSIKRYASDAAGKSLQMFGEPTKKEKVAIIGSGPAGLTAAVCLREQGYGVTVFERASVAGGMLTACIPEYRLPQDIINSEIKDIEQAGIPIKLNTELGKDISISGLFKEGYGSIFIATGAHKSTELDVRGIEGHGVFTALDFLRKVRAREPVDVGAKVVVIGGGNAAIDAARSALRLGAQDVKVLYRRSRTEMPAIEEEIEAAEREGVEIIYLIAPSAIIREQEKVTCIECCGMELCEPDESGRRRPAPIDGSKSSISADTIIIATGQIPDLKASDGDLKFTGNGFLWVDSETLETSIRGVFAGGDVVWQGSVIDAIAQGRKATETISRFLAGSSYEREKCCKEDLRTYPFQGQHIRDKRQKNILTAEESVGNFNEIDRGLDCGTAREEANQCLRCDIPILVDIERCTGCQTCAYYCSLAKHGSFNPQRAYLKIKVNTVFGKLNDISFTDDCDDCGICARYCPYSALTRESDLVQLR